MSIWRRVKMKSEVVFRGDEKMGKNSNEKIMACFYGSFGVKLEEGFGEEKVYEFLSVDKVYTRIFWGQKCE